MSLRFCHGCNAEVEIVEGACLLGHQPRAVTPSSPLADIRAEVDQAFDEARLEVEAISLVTPVPGRVPAAVGAAMQQAAEHAGTAQPLSGGPETLTPESQTPRYLGPPLAPPPPPPPARRDRPSADGGSRMPSNNDPITQFAPPPRVDWGPERLSLFGLGRLLRSR